MRGIGNPPKLGRTPPLKGGSTSAPKRGTPCIAGGDMTPRHPHTLCLARVKGGKDRDKLWGTVTGKGRGEHLPLIKGGGAASLGITMSQQT